MTGRAIPGIGLLRQRAPRATRGIPTRASRGRAERPARPCARDVRTGGVTILAARTPRRRNRSATSTATEPSIRMPTPRMTRPTSGARFSAEPAPISSCQPRRASLVVPALSCQSRRGGPAWSCAASRASATNPTRAARPSGRPAGSPLHGRALEPSSDVQAGCPVESLRRFDRADGTDPRLAPVRAARSSPVPVTARVFSDPNDSGGIPICGGS